MAFFCPRLKFTKCNFRNAVIKGVSFKGSDLKRSIFKDPIVNIKHYERLPYDNFEDQPLGVDFTNAELSGTNW